MAKKNELGAQVLELIPEVFREDLVEEIKNQLIERGIVAEVPKVSQKEKLARLKSIVDDVKR